MSPEKAIETADLPIPKREGNTSGTTVWMDYPMLKDLDIIAAYEHLKRGPLIRTILIDKIRCYKRNPAFKRFLVQLRQGEEDKKHHEGKDE